MIHIVHDNIMARIENLPERLKSVLYDELKYRPDGYEHVYSFQSHRWDGWNRLFNMKDCSFRRGLVSRVLDILNDSDCGPINIKHTTPQPVGIDVRFRDAAIRSFVFQDEAVEAGVKNDVGIVVAPTGSGKSVVISKLISELRLKTLVIVTDIVLLDQMHQVLQRYFDQQIGIIGDGEFDLQDITVSTIQSLLSFTKPPKNEKDATKKKSFLNYAKSVAAIISDEAHQSDTSSFNEVIPLFIGCNKFLGFSATPYGWAEKAEKRQNLELEQHFGKVIFDCRKLNFIELGLKVPLIINAIHRKAINENYNKHQKRGYGGKIVPDSGKNYKDCIDTELIKNPDYHIEIANQAIQLNATGKSAFIHAAHSIEFGKNICDLIHGAVLVNGKTPRKDRREVYDAMRKKELLTIVSDVGGTGLDIPSLDAILLASDIKDIRQLKGRVERKGLNKDYGMLIDWNTDTHFLRKHHLIRRSQYEHDGHIIIG